LLDEGGIHAILLISIKLRIPNLNKNFDKQILSAKIQNQKGKSPYFQLRFLNIIHGLSLNLSWNPRGRLRSSHPLKKASLLNGIAWFKQRCKETVVIYRAKKKLIFGSGTKNSKLKEKLLNFLANFFWECWHE